jgi:xanthine dehydrogenase accessory factor
MKALEIWDFLQARLQTGQNAALLIVVDSRGSSPGRQGFKMAVAADGQMTGSIGGGIMEHKLVEWVMDRLSRNLPFWEIRHQIHSKDAPHNQSGMICSGEQTIAMLCCKPDLLETITQIATALRTAAPIMISITETSFCAFGLAGLDTKLTKSQLDHETSSSTSGDAFPKTLDNANPPSHNKTFSQTVADTWTYREQLGLRDVAHVIGAGHVGLAMCKILAALDFFVVNYDDRPGLNTMEANAYADQKIVTPYPELDRYIQGGADQYVIVMTFGYRGDDEAMRALLGKQFGYLGMMGSATKVSKLLGDLRRDGFVEADIAMIHAPAGLVTHCKTPAEIAVSIAAEIVQVSHRSAPN